MSAALAAHDPAARWRTIPEPGQLVEARRRQWVVADVDAAASAPGGAAQHLVRLASLDEDALGEEIELVWELEPGAHVLERAGLPRFAGLDDAAALDAFLDAVRWGTVTHADRGYVQAPFRSGAAIEDYQLDPLVRAIDMARVHLLIADDVGLGKTIEAGLVAQEMILRHRARTVLVLCPASLQEKWRLEMQEKFGLEFRIVDTDYVKRLRRERGLHANPWTSFPRLVASFDWAKQGEGWRALRDALPARLGLPRAFDLLIVDEAHHVAPSVGRYAVESQRTRLVRLVAPHFQHKLFLTATPHDGYTESFTALLELLDDQRFARIDRRFEREALPPRMRAQLERVMVRRLKSDLVDADGRPLYPKRRLEALTVRRSDAERAARALLERYIASREAGAGGGAAGRFVHQLLRKRLASSPAAFATTLEQHVATLDGRRAERSSSALDERILRRAIAKTRDDFADDTQREAAEAEAIGEAGRHGRAPTDEERRLLAELRAWTQQTAPRADSKADAVVAWLERELRPDGQWTESRAILFTEYRTTQLWLQQVLTAHGLGGDRLALLYGGMDPDEREAVKAAFQASPAIAPVRILLATDAASEGIDLQNHCHRLLHLEIPYNPNVMEQRNGRIDRHGQRAAEVAIWHPVEADGTHADDLMRAVRKLDAMRADVGSVNPLIVPQFAELLDGQRRELDLRAVEARNAKARRLVKAERDVRERVARLHERLSETAREQHLAPERVERAVRTALRLADKPDLAPASLPGVPTGKLFRLPALDGSWARCLEGLAHPYTRAIRPVTFDHAVARGRDDVVLIHLNHPLVQTSLRLLRAEVWARDDIARLHRVALRALPDERLDAPAIAAIARLVVTGGRHHRLHEELTEAGGWLRGASFRREERVGEVRRWLDESVPAVAVPALVDDLRARFERHRDALMAAVEARSKERVRYVTNMLEARKRRDLDDLRDVLDDLERTLRDELAEAAAPVQLDLWSEDERTQYRRDRTALEARLARLPGERAQEAAALDGRYASIEDRTFPIAIVVVVPASMLDGAPR